MERRQRLKLAVTSYQVRLTHYLCSVTGNLEVARELSQETFIKLMQADLNKISERAEKAWLFKVGRNLALDWLKRQGRVVASPDVDEWAQDEKETPSGFGDLLQVVEKLPAQQRELIRLRYQHDLSYKEIAQVTDLTESNIGYILHQAHKQIKELLARNEAGA